MIPAMRLPAPSSIPGFELAYEDLDSTPIPLRCFRFPGGLDNRDRAVICIPGMSASGLSFARFRPLASEYDFRLLSSPVEEYPGGARRAFADAVFSVVEQFKRPVLLGTSFGGLVAIDVASRATRDIRGLVLPAAFARNRVFPPPLRPLEKLLTRLQWLAKIVAPISTKFVGGFGLDREAAAELSRQAAEVSTENRRQRLKDVFETDLRAMLPALDIPSLVVYGSRDGLVARRDTLELAALLPLCEYHEIRGAYHVPYLSHADEFNGLLERFLERVF